MCENEVPSVPDYYKNSMTLRKMNRCHTVVVDVYSTLCCA